MLERIHDLIEKKEDFAFETTLATRSYLGIIRKAQKLGYFISLVFFWLESENLAIQRVKKRVSEGGHHIPEVVIRRRYKRGINNLFKLFFNEVDYLLIFDNSGPIPILVAEKETKLQIINVSKFESIKFHLI